VRQEPLRPIDKSTGWVIVGLGAVGVAGEAGFVAYGGATRTVSDIVFGVLVVINGAEVIWLPLRAFRRNNRDLRAGMHPLLCLAAG
jgi:hypothetical protein